MLNDLNLPPLEARRQNIRLPYFYKINKRLVPAIPLQWYLTPKRQGRSIRAKVYEGFNTTNTVDRPACVNSQDFNLPPSKTDQYRQSFFIRTALEWDHLSDSIVNCDSVEDFKLALESRD